MMVTTADHTSSIMDRKQVYLYAEMRGITANRVSVEGQYSVYHLKGHYDLIIGKNWMTANSHAVDFLSAEKT
jgi:hypothetical protein